jgi:phosphohistidine phosphatase
MTLRLILIRHAKSSWDDFSIDDHDRQLNERGRRAAPAIGKWIAERGDVPTEVLCSDAKRTRETLGLLMEQWPTAPAVRYLPSLYLAPATTMLAELKTAQAPIVAMIGHNPGIGSFACGLVHERPQHPKYASYPTCATAIIDFDVARWSEVVAASGRVVAFTTPRDIQND